MATSKAGALLATLVFWLLFSAPSFAHPHILASLRLEVVYGHDGGPSELRQWWHYDPAYSAFALRQADRDNDGGVSASELQAFAKEQGAALATFGYYTTIMKANEDVALSEVTEVSVKMDDLGSLTLHFALPFKLPATSEKRYTIEIFDPQFLAYFSLQTENGATLVGAPAECSVTSSGPAPIDLKNTRSVPATFWAALDGSTSAGRQFVNRINVSCL